MKTDSKPMKLKEILSTDSTQEDMDLHIDTCKNNTELEMLKVREEINKQQKVINAVYKNEAFSASTLYTERYKLQLLNEKLTGLQNILKELF